MTALNEEKFAALVIRNTLTKKRSQNLYEFALELEKQKRIIGNLKVLADKYGISANMLNRFLSVLKVPQSIQNMVIEGQINNINAIYYMHTLPASDQLFLSKLLIDGKINSIDIRALRPMMNRFPNETVEALIDKILKTKDIKTYSVKFDIKSSQPVERIAKNLNTYISRDYFKITSDKGVGNITLSSIGIKQLKQYAKDENQSFKEFMIKIIGK